MWRGSLLPLGCEADPISTPQSPCQDSTAGFRAAAQPNGSKLPRHGWAASREWAVLCRPSTP
ncbi:hypothetical protein QCBJ_26410 [Pseudomonas sp. QC2]|nr:hypothetical protein QCBJ_26410 [Pseudomonas sp. QC2]